MRVYERSSRRRSSRNIMGNGRFAGLSQIPKSQVQRVPPRPTEMAPRICQIGAKPASDFTYRYALIGGKWDKEVFPGRVVFNPNNPLIFRVSSRSSAPGNVKLLVIYGVHKKLKPGNYIEVPIETVMGGESEGTTFSPMMVAGKDATLTVRMLVDPPELSREDSIGDVNAEEIGTRYSISALRTCHEVVGWFLDSMRRKGMENVTKEDAGRHVYNLSMAAFCATEGAEAAMMAFDLDATGPRRYRILLSISNSVLKSIYKMIGHLKASKDQGGLASLMEARKEAERYNKLSSIWTKMASAAIVMESATILQYEKLLRTLEMVDPRIIPMAIEAQGSIEGIAKKKGVAVEEAEAAVAVLARINQSTGKPSPFSDQVFGALNDEDIEVFARIMDRTHKEILSSIRSDARAIRAPVPGRREGVSLGDLGQRTVRATDAMKEAWKRDSATQDRALAREIAEMPEAGRGTGDFPIARARRTAKSESAQRKIVGVIRRVSDLITQSITQFFTSRWVYTESEMYKRDVRALETIERELVELEGARTRAANKTVNAQNELTAENLKPPGERSGERVDLLNAEIEAETAKKEAADRDISEKTTTAEALRSRKNNPAMTFVENANAAVKAVIEEVAAAKIGSPADVGDLLGKVSRKLREHDIVLKLVTVESDGTISLVNRDSIKFIIEAIRELPSKNVKQMARVLRQFLITTSTGWGRRGTEAKRRVDWFFGRMQENLEAQLTAKKASRRRTSEALRTATNLRSKDGYRSRLRIIDSEIKGLKQMVEAVKKAKGRSSRPQFEPAIEAETLPPDLDSDVDLSEAAREAEERAKAIEEGRYTTLEGERREKLAEGRESLHKIKTELQTEVDELEGLLEEMDGESRRKYRTLPTEDLPSGKKPPDPKPARSGWFTGKSYKAIEAHVKVLKGEIEKINKIEQAIGKARSDTDVGGDTAAKNEYITQDQVKQFESPGVAATIRNITSDALPSSPMRTNSLILSAEGNARLTQLRRFKIGGAVLFYTVTGPGFLPTHYAVKNMAGGGRWAGACLGLGIISQLAWMSTITLPFLGWVFAGTAVGTLADMGSFGFRLLQRLMEALDPDKEEKGANDPNGGDVGSGDLDWLGPAFKIAGIAFLGSLVFAGPKMFPLISKWLEKVFKAKPGRPRAPGGAAAKPKVPGRKPGRPKKVQA